MKKRFSLPKEIGSKKRDIARPNCSTHLYEEDHSEIIRLCRAEGVGESEALRLIVSDWIRMKKVLVLGKDQTEDPIRRIYERVIDERITPLSDSINQIKSSVEILSKSRSTASAVSPASQPQNGEILSVLNTVRELLEQTNNGLSESSSTQISLLDELQQSQKVHYGVSCETYASTWTTIDFILRFVVEAALLAQETDPSEIGGIILRDRVGLRQMGLRKIADVARFFKLPQDFELVKDLAQNFSPLPEEATAGQLP